MPSTRRSTVDLVIEAMHSVGGAGGEVFFDWALAALLRVSPSVAVLPRALADESVWQSSDRVKLMANMGDLWDRIGRDRTHFRANPASLDASRRGGASLAAMISHAEALSMNEGSPNVHEWHIASAMIEADQLQTMAALGVEVSVLLRRVAELEGRVDLSPEDRGKVWCFVDANVFLQYRNFDQVNWSKKLGHASVVLVVPTSVLRALDHYKDSYKLERPNPRAQKKARQVLPLLAKYALLSPPATPAPVARAGRGVELLLRHVEPEIPGDFDPQDQDDRIIADALDFKWRHPGARVVILSGDYTVRLKARGRGLEQQEVPPDLELASNLPP